MFAAMRLIHTADWHLGRLFHGVHLTADQADVLEQLVALVREVRPHAVLVAGDLYDRAVPPTEAVDLLDHVLSEIVLGLGVAVVAIAGNHDSPARVDFAAGLTRERGLHLVGRPRPEGARLVLADKHGPVHVLALPFADAALARHAYGEADLHDQQAVVATGVARALASTPADERRVLVTHAFVAGGEPSESERPLTAVGGADQVAAGTFAGFDYVALGHLHRPQQAGAATVRYAGSLLKYSFAEHDHRKSVSVVDIGSPGSAEGDAGAAGRARVAVEQVELRPPREVRRLEGSFDDLLARGRDDPRRDDYVLAVLRDRGAVIDPIARLREVYPNTLAVERPELLREGRAGRRRPDPRRVSEAQMFADFFTYVTGEPPTAAQAAAFAETVDTLLAAQREATT